jgi:glycosyltransferase involved in cell wall biosynthesis
MKILFLYYELAQYTHACVKQLPAYDEIHVVAYPVNIEAPFAFEPNANTHLYDRKNLDLAMLTDLYREISPDLLVCAGWSDQDYLQIAKSAKNVNTCVTILAFDNQWKNTFRQLMGVATRGASFSNIFDYAFIPGQPQREFALKLGFDEDRILHGVYSCDFEYFSNLREEFELDKARAFPHKFLYVGRYVKHKGIFAMWQAFIELTEETNHDWELWCVGTGEEFCNRMEHQSIRHFGFVQPNDIKEIIRETGVFILPSHFEPWGVVVHEFAAAGLPLILSDQVGSASEFLVTAENGFSFKSKNVSSIKKAMKKIISLSDDTLTTYGNESFKQSMKITPNSWAATLTGTVEHVNQSN